MDRSAARRRPARRPVPRDRWPRSLFDGPALGINVPVGVAAPSSLAWLVRRRGTAPDPLDAWLPDRRDGLAAFVACPGDRLLIVLDTLAALGFTGATAVAMSGVPVTRRGADIVAGLATLGHRCRPDRAPAPTLRGGSAPPWHAAAAAGVALRPVGRGLLIGLPIAVLFAVLFASADPIFRRSMDDLLGFSIDLGELPGRVVFMLAVCVARGRPAQRRGQRRPAVGRCLARRGGAAGSRCRGRGRSGSPRRSPCWCWSTWCRALSSRSRSRTCSVASTRWRRPA